MVVFEDMFDTHFQNHYEGHFTVIQGFGALRESRFVSNSHGEMIINIWDTARDWDMRVLEAGEVIRPDDALAVVYLVRHNVHYYKCSFRFRANDLFEKTRSKKREKEEESDEEESDEEETERKKRRIGS